MAFAQHFFAADAQDVLGRGVEVDEPPLAVTGKEAVPDAFERDPELLLGIPWSGPPCPLAPSAAEPPIPRRPGPRTCPVRSCCTCLPAMHCPFHQGLIIIRDSAEGNRVRSPYPLGRRVSSERPFTGVVISRGGGGANRRGGRGSGALSRVNALSNRCGRRPLKGLSTWHHGEERYLFYSHYASNPFMQFSS